MARTAVSGRLTTTVGWRAATVVAERFETRSARTLLLEVDGWPGHRPGQHIDVRLTAPDGYHAERSYSLATPSNGDRVEITVQRVPGGEVSEYLVDGLPIGARIEIRGPIGGWFVWDPEHDGAAVLVAGGSGIVPVRAILRARLDAATTVPFRVIYSLRSPEQSYYSDEIFGIRRPDVAVYPIYTRTAPPQYPRSPGRMTRADLETHGLAPAPSVTCFVCGPTGFVESAAAGLLSLGHDAARIKTERFGPTGDDR
ncbi:ferredoxin reductase [Nocardia sp. NPDC056952]|uniref:ferredoxin reductase n=1 Tax=Nocardia sp. NPDC056952 TaxID=3345979 RepID=UPI00363CAE68